MYDRCELVNTVYTPIAKEDMKNSDTFTSPSNDELENESIKLDIYINKRQL